MSDLFSPPGGWRVRILDLSGAAAQPMLIAQAVAGAGVIPDGWERSVALASIVQWLAAADPRNPALTELALAVAGPSRMTGGVALAGIAVLLAAVDPTRAAALIWCVSMPRGARPGRLLDGRLCAGLGGDRGGVALPPAVIAGSHRWPVVMTAWSWRSSAAASAACACPVDRRGSRRSWHRRPG